MSTTTRPLRIAILAHSTNPRGGVVHALEVADALTRLGHEAVVHAPDAAGTGFFRPTLCKTVVVPASSVGRDTAAMVEIRVADYLNHFAEAANRRFDVFHAQDGISGNALATLKARGLISSFVRTVHHVEAFADPKLQMLQQRSIVSADLHLVVSRTWRDELAARFGLSATVVGNGVDTDRYTAQADGREADLRTRFNIGRGPVFLSVGGVEQRKNTVRILEAFAQARSIHQKAQLVIAGGASLLDHGAYQQQFAKTLAASGLSAGAVLQTGPIAQVDMPALYRIADALVFPSVMEGFGLVVLEAMASGLPVITSRIPPFTEHLGDDDVIWCNPQSVASIANAMTTVCGQELRRRLKARGDALVKRHDWRQTARAHVRAYETLREPQYA